MFEIHSSAFEQGQPIPSRHTCEGDDISPPLAWSGAPEGTKSYALLVDDPDAPDPAAPKRLWLHWIRYNIGPDVQELAEGAGNNAPTLGAQDLRNDDKVAGWSGPCPPRGRHRYFFHLYALDTMLTGLGEGATRKEFEHAMEGHVLGTAEMMGTYQKAGRREGGKAGG
ncbi:MAG TPA: YbhB/YbcL family Raf kinase inhibitor-like protein [Gemmatimonadales bacterium]|nr:YbhB/YbcL family Raf kinase inhibitor-like protein [Gemmatimonadales bacterium]